MAGRGASQRAGVSWPSHYATLVAVQSGRPWMAMEMAAVPHPKLFVSLVGHLQCAKADEGGRGVTERGPNCAAAAFARAGPQNPGAPRSRCRATLLARWRGQRAAERRAVRVRRVEPQYGWRSLSQTPTVGPAWRQEVGCGGRVFFPIGSGAATPAPVWRPTRPQRWWQVQYGRSTGGRGGRRPRDSVPHRPCASVLGLRVGGGVGSMASSGQS